VKDDLSTLESGAVMRWSVKDKACAENIHRLRSAAGHIDGIVGMLEADRSCIEVVKQIQAAQTALARVSESLLNEHLHICIAALSNGDSHESERLLAEITEVFPSECNLRRLS